MNKNDEEEMYDAVLSMEKDVTYIKGKLDRHCERLDKNERNINDNEERIDRISGMTKGMILTVSLAAALATVYVVL